VLHIWFISCRMASVGLMHNLSKIIVIPYSAGDATQLEMPAECVCMRTRKTKTYCDYRVYKSINVPVLYNIQACSNQYISTYDMEVGENSVCRFYDTEKRRRKTQDIYRRHWPLQQYRVSDLYHVTGTSTLITCSYLPKLYPTYCA
jgi:hypothetical protein